MSIEELFVERYKKQEEKIQELEKQNKLLNLDKQALVNVIDEVVWFFSKIEVEDRDTYIRTGSIFDYEGYERAKKLFKTMNFDITKKQEKVKETRDE